MELDWIAASPQTTAPLQVWAQEGINGHVRGHGCGQSQARPASAGLVPVWRTAPPAQPSAQRQAAIAYEAFAARGGLASGDEVAELMREGAGEAGAQPISTLARWIVGRQVLNFTWQSQTLIPLFQFDLSRMTVRPGVLALLAELAPAFDELELASWFVRPNSCLRGAAPIDHMEHDLLAALSAARADRFVVMG